MDVLNSMFMFAQQFLENYWIDVSNPCFICLGMIQLRSDKNFLNRLSIFWQLHVIIPIEVQHWSHCVYGFFQLIICIITK